MEHIELGLGWISVEDLNALRYTERSEDSRWQGNFGLGWGQSGRGGPHMFSARLPSASIHGCR